MESINLIKALYHFVAFLLLGYLSCMTIQCLSIKFLVIIIALVHLYDTYWFLTNDELAPI
jgi:heme/copper-type cytochrome/quinol oxidase subunit 4